MKMIDEDSLDRLRWRFPKGSEAELVRMDDPQAPPVGTRGKVMFVDDVGTIHVNWDTGSTLGAVYEEDEILPVCPICQKAYSRHPAISRRDNRTHICPDCGLRQGMCEYGIPIGLQDTLLKLVHEKESELENLSKKK